VKLREVAAARSGDKGDVSNVCVFPYDEDDWDFVREAVTVDAVRELFSDLVAGDIVRYEMPGPKGLNFVFTKALAGGASRSLRTDVHGKAYASRILELEVPERQP
jgi:hypothetical protein